MADSVLIIGDTHFPFHSVGGVQSLVKFAAKHKPDMIIQVGDLKDLYSYSKYPRSQNVVTPEDEYSGGTAAATRMWSDIKRVVGPKTKCFQMLGNHDERAIKRTMERMPEAETVMREWIRSNYTFKGVELIEEVEFIHQGICYMHGFRQHGDHAKYNQMNTVVGHLHRGGVVYDAGVKGGYWELNAGWLGEGRSPVFSYQAQKRISKTTLGFGYIDDYGPRFISL